MSDTITIKEGYKFVVNGDHGVVYKIYDKYVESTNKIKTMVEFYYEPYVNIHYAEELDKFIQFLKNHSDDYLPINEYNEITELLSAVESKIDTARSISDEGKIGLNYLICIIKTNLKQLINDGAHQDA